MLLGHGDDAPQNLAANFSSNIWYGADNKKLYSHLAGQFGKIRRYPEVQPIGLIEKIASFHNLPANNILVTNGATEAIYLIAHAFSQSRTTIIFPAFSEYEDACTLYKHKLSFIAESEIIEKMKFSDQLVFIGNPNNPTGKAYPKNFIGSILKNNPDTIFVIDEAYADFTITNNSVTDYIRKYPNLIIIRSLTKTFCIPGLRLGYIVSDHNFIQQVERYKMPWSVNTLAIEAGKYLFDSISMYQIPLQAWLNETHWLMQEIKNLQKFRVSSSDTPYFLCETMQPDASLVKQYLLDQFAILIRDASNFRGLTSNHFRICTRAHAENDQLINALRQWITLF